MSEGWIYVLSNEHMPGLVKIGQTANDPSKRAQELENTGVPGKFEIEYQGLFEGYAQLELSVHRALAEHRVSPKREFFRIDVSTAILAIHDAALLPPKREESKKDRLLQVERLRRKAELEEGQRRERERIKKEAYARAREKMEAFNNDQNEKIELYVQGKRDLAFELLVPASIFIVLSGVIYLLFDSFAVGVILGAFLAFFAGSSIKSGRGKIRSEAEAFFPRRQLEDFLDSSTSTDKESKANKSSALSYRGSATKECGKINITKKRDEQKNVDASSSFECRECSAKIEVKQTLGFFSFSCHSCGQQYLFDRPSYTLEPKITYKF